MADYKDIISGTLGNLVGKVKEVADSGAVRNIYQQGSNRAKAYARITKLSLEINGENEELRRVYAEIGRLYYDIAKDDPQGYFASLFSQAEDISSRIALKEQEIQQLKEDMDSQAQPDIQVEFEAEDVFQQAEEAFEEAAERFEDVVEDSFRRGSGRDEDND